MELFLVNDQRDAQIPMAYDKRKSERSNSIRFFYIPLTVHHVMILGK